MKKLLSIFGAVSLTAIASSTVISCQKNKIPLGTVILFRDLGPIAMAGATPTLEELVIAIQAKNSAASSLNTENIGIVGQATATSAVVQGLREYQDSLTVTYTKSGAI